MSKTAYQLWWDREFIEKRILEQKEYSRTKLYSLQLSDAENKRRYELYSSSEYILARLEHQLDLIKQLL